MESTADTKSLKQLNNPDLLREVECLVKKERQLSTEILRYLREIYQRRLHAQMGFSSLFCFCVEHLKYSPAQAQRRIESMKLLTELPELENKINQGELNLTQVAQAGSFFSKEKKLNQVSFSIEEKKQVLQEISGHSTRETEKLLLGKSAKPAVHQNRSKTINATQTELRIIADEKLMNKLKKIQGIWAHDSKCTDMSYLLDKMTDLVLEKIDPLQKANNWKMRQVKQNDTAARPALKASSRKIPRSLWWQVWLKDKAQCTWKNPQTGKICGSKHNLEAHHTIPWSKLKLHDIRYLELRCKLHHDLEHMTRSKRPRFEKNAREDLPTFEVITPIFF